MSFGGGSIRRNRSTKSSTNPVHGQLVSVIDASKSRRPYGTAAISLVPRTDLHDPSGEFTQHRSAVPTVESPDDPSIIYPQSAPSSPTKSGKKKTNQWKRWTDKVIPALLQPFLRILEESESLREVGEENVPCHCGSPGLDVICVYFQSMFG